MTSHCKRRRRRLLAPLILGALFLALAVFGIEGVRAYGFYQDVRAAKETLTSLKSDIDFANLEEDEASVVSRQLLLKEAGDKLRAARRFSDDDPLLAVGGRIPVLGEQANALKDLVRAADESTTAGVTALDVALAFKRYERAPGETPLAAGLGFVRDQEGPMRELSDSLIRLKRLQAALPANPWGPMGNAADDLDEAIAKLEGLVDGYEQASAFLPKILGFDGPQRYLLLPQNDTELFPSGGLMSSYGVVTFDRGNLAEIEIEYFVDLYNRWQETSNGEYIEPPAPLKNYLLKHYSWALGEAGWFPDFPTSAELAQTFVAKGGAEPTDGTIAIDLQFLIGLLGLTGEVHLAAYEVTVTPANVEEVALEYTREDNRSSANHQAFLSHLSQSLLTRLFATPKEQWIDVLQFLDKMGKERHLQLAFNAPELQALSTAYGFDGALQTPEAGDFLYVADTSVNSTKLNLILEPSLDVEVLVRPNGTARTLVTFEIYNPFAEWKVGRDPQLVADLMIGGVYGSYSRVYAPEGSRLLDVRVDGMQMGAEQDGTELGKAVFGRFFRVLPGATSNVQFLYETPSVTWTDKDGIQHYALTIQKQAGTKAVPLGVRITLPAGAEALSSTLDGRDIDIGESIVTDLKVDRRIELTYRTR